MKLYALVVVLIIVSIFCKIQYDNYTAAKPASIVDDTIELSIKPIGYIASSYMDNYKWMPIKYSQELYNLFEVVNLVHPGDILAIKDAGIFVPVAKVISVMEVDKAFPVIVLDRSIQLGGREFGVAPTDKSIDLWNTTLYPDPIKTPVTEIQSVSRWVAAVPKKNLIY